ncbi:MAG TPA: ribokinase [Armatimonadota bacterium]|jgi:ribokinase
MSTLPAQIIVIGSANTDMVVDVPTLPGPGETVLGGAFRLTPGGKGANQAVAAARAGGRVTFLTAVGDDGFGEESLQRFAAEGMETRYIRTKAGTPSGVALIMVDARGENLIAVAPGANGRLAPEDVDAEAFMGARMAILQLEIPLDTVLRAVTCARAAGCPVLLNPAPMPAAGLPDALLRQVSILTPNEHELLALAPGVPSVDVAAEQVLARGPEALVVTQGAKGAAVFTRDERFQVPALPVNAVDTVGAGDCFSACLGVALAEGRALREAVRFAVTAAGISATRVGAQAAMPRRGEIEGAGGG